MKGSAAFAIQYGTDASVFYLLYHLCSLCAPSLSLFIYIYTYLFLQLQTEKDPLLNVAAYQDYLQHLQQSDGPVQVQNLYERAVLKHPQSAGYLLP